MRIKDLKDLQKKVFQIPDDSLVYHLSRNHFSRFFYSRAMFPPAEVLKHVDVSDYKDMDEARKLIFDLIVQYRRFIRRIVLMSIVILPVSATVRWEVRVEVLPLSVRW